MRPQSTPSAQAAAAPFVALDPQPGAEPPSDTRPQAAGDALASIIDPVALAPLWERYWQGREVGTRNDLLLAYEPLVGRVVSRLPANVRSYWEADDLQSFGILGLVESIDRWQQGSDPTRFAHYAMKRVRGAIFDELRRLDWLPRTVRRRVISYRATVDSLSSELGRVPATSEVIEQMGVEGQACADLLSEVQSSQLLHLQHAVAGEAPGEELRLVDLIASQTDDDPEAHLLHEEQLAALRQAVTRLPERQRAAVTLHLLGGLTQKQIGAMLGVSNSRVCQIEASALQTLRRLLSDEPTRARGALAAEAS